MKNMKMIKVVGDIHGNISHLQSLCKNDCITFCLGDIGFFEEYKYMRVNSDLFPNLVIVPGNHDYFPQIENMYDVRTVNDVDLMYIGGAESIDKNQRTEGVDWFKEEEIPYIQWTDVIETASGWQPDIMFSHDCPWSVSQELFNYKNKPSLTSRGLDEVLSNIRKLPAVWYFGHHHRSTNYLYKDERGTCLFTCLDECETKVIRI